jgi:hypothetical protein
MRKLTALAVGLVALLSALPSSAAPGSVAPKEDRVEERTYARPAGIWTSHFDEGMRSLPEETLTFKPKRGDRWINFEFRDVTGRDVLAHITQGAPHDPDSVNGVHPYSDGDIVCATRHSFKLDGTAEVQLKLYAGLCPNHTFGYATSGIVVATFSRSS